MFCLGVMILVGTCTEVFSASQKDRLMYQYWFDEEKDKSYAGLSSNLTDRTVLVLGSSEFRRDRISRFHPRNLFPANNIELMTIGSAWNQTLFHGIAVGALAPKLSSKKVVLLVSPTWFDQQGVSQKEYALRFSETEYMRFMENVSIPRSIKNYVAKRSVQLLQKNKSKLAKLRMINNALLYTSSNKLCLMQYQSEKSWAEFWEKQIMKSRRKKMRKAERKRSASRVVIRKKGDWFRLIAAARKKCRKQSHNSFYMKDSAWNGKYKKQYKIKKKRPLKVSTMSPEYRDYQAFLEICKATGIKVKVIIQPMNGRWYDRIKTGKNIRWAASKRIANMAVAYGAQVEDLSRYDYEKYIVQDAQHPWDIGWLRINRAIWSFCK